jgi:uncharacterized membrane protein
MRTTSFLGGILAGAGFVYLADPVSGRRRRSLVLDKGRHFARDTRQSIDRAARDLTHRLQGKVAEARHLIASGAADDEVLKERVRAALGRASSHPHAIGTKVRAGRVMLDGLVLASEVKRVIDAVEHVRGVHRVENQMSSKESGEGIPSLQGGRPSSRRGWRRPSERLASGVAGGALVGASLIERSMLPGLLGGALLLRSLMSRRNRGWVEFEKTLHLHASCDQCFALFSDFASFPRFMQHVREVKPIGERWWRWTAEGPAGSQFTWDASVTAFVPNQMIAWRSLPGGDLECAGRVRFEETRDGCRLTVLLRYRPPAGAVGHAIASLFGKDAKNALDDDLLRFKSLAEQGKARGRGPQVTRDQLLH